MPRKKPETAISPLLIGSHIHIIRDVRVMLDSDLAELYGVETFVLLQELPREPSDE